MHIVITGGTGFIGTALVQHLIAAGHHCLVLTRGPRPAAPGITWLTHQPTDVSAWTPAVDVADAIINLAGESVGTRRWTPAYKQGLLESRVGITRALVDAINAARHKPRVLINASAVGVYGSCGDCICTEDAKAAQRDFLVDLASAWEEAAAAVLPVTRLVLLRLGVVLGPSGGFLQRLLPLFRMGLGGPVGDGRQWMSWVHRDDVVGVIDAALHDERYRGAINVVSPNPTTNADFARTLGQALHRPALVRVPACIIRLVLGEQAILALGSTRVAPQRLQQLGYRFRFAALDTALRDCVS